MSRSSIFLASLLTFVLLQEPCAAQDSLLLRQQLIRYKSYFNREGISLDSYAFDNATINAKLLDVPRNDQKAQNKLVGAGLLAGLGIGLMALSGSGSKSTTTTYTSGQLFAFDLDLKKPFLFSIGLVSTMVAIPLGISSTKHRKDRNEALAEVKEYFLYTY